MKLNMNITKYKNIKLNNQITHFLVIVIFVVTVIVSMCFKMNNVVAEITSSNLSLFGYQFDSHENEDGYGYLTGYDGLFIRICVKAKGCNINNNSNYIEGLHFFNDASSGALVSLSRLSAMDTSLSGSRPSAKVVVKKSIKELSSLNYMNPNVGIASKDILEGNNYQIIKNIIKTEAQANGMSYENFFQNGDFVIAEPVAGFRFRVYTYNEYGAEIRILSTINAIRTLFKTGGTHNATHPAIIPSCPDSYYNGDHCPVTYWLGPVFTNMLTFRTGEWNNNKLPNCQLYTGSTKGCGFFKFNYNDINNPDTPKPPTDPDEPEEETCESMFESIDIYDMDERIELYEEWGYKGLLDMSNTTAEDACGPSSCGKSASTSCLSGNYENKYFDDEDISCFNATYSTSSGGTAYCLESFTLRNNLSSSTFYTRSGRLPIQYLNKTIAATGTLTRKCYIYGGGSLSKPKYSNYVSEVKLDNRILNYDLTESASGSWWNVYTGTAKYYLNPIYAKTGTGEVSYNALNNYYKFMGYGVISQFKSKSQYSIQFSLSLGSKFPLSTKNYSSTSCKVIPTQEVVITDDDPKKPDKLRLEFRIIDTNNPFPGKNGNVRIVGTNWRATSNLKSTNSNYSNWVNNDWKKSNSYINHSYAERADNKGFNSYASYIMETTNNSYNKNETGPKYKFLLKPIDLKNIKDYNKENKYDDFTLTCGKDATNCESKRFFDAVGIKNLVSNKG